LFEQGLYSGDPDPANHLFLPDGRVACVDFGGVREPAPGLVARLAALTHAAWSGDRALVDRAAAALGIAPPDEAVLHALYGPRPRRCACAWSRRPGRSRSSWRRRISTSFSIRRRNVAEHDWNARYAEGNLPWDTGAPDEHLVASVRAGVVTPGRTLEIGCGTGTNALW